MGFLNDLRSILAYFHNDPMDRQVVFYSEGKPYWQYLRDILEACLDELPISICYISSDRYDPGLELVHPKLKSFLVSEGSARTWLFENLDASFCIMTMPDLESFQIKRSRHPVHYIYVQHALMSLHMAYRDGAFDAFDTVCCSSKYQIDELRAIETQKNLKEKNILRHGYQRIWDLKLQAQKLAKLPSVEKGYFKNMSDNNLSVLIAPSWGKNALIESGVAEGLVRALLDSNVNVILRPHPQTAKVSCHRVNKIIQKFSSEPNFVLDGDVSSSESLFQSDFMICDWSGVAFDYAFGLGKPILFVDTPPKVNNPNFGDIPITPFEIQMRDKIGTVVAPEDVVDFIQDTDLKSLKNTLNPEEYFYKPDPILVTQFIKRGLDQRHKPQAF